MNSGLRLCVALAAARPFLEGAFPEEKIHSYPADALVSVLAAGVQGSRPLPMQMEQSECVGLLAISDLSRRRRS